MNNILVFSVGIVFLVIILFAIINRGRKKDGGVSGSGSVSKQEQKQMQPMEKKDVLAESQQLKEFKTEKQALNEKTDSEEPAEKDNYLLGRIDMFSPKNSFWDGQKGNDNIEKKVYKMLKAFIDDAYIIIPHVPFREIFYWNWESDWRLTNRVTKMHFDFGIYNEDMQPIFFLEIQGKGHKENPKEIERDKFKAEVMKKCKIKLITVDCSKSMTDSETRDKLVSRIKEEIPDRKACPTYCPNCKSQGKNSLMIIKRNNTKGTFFYGCSTYDKINSDKCSFTLNLDDVPLLYWGMPLFKDKDKQ